MWLWGVAGSLLAVATVLLLHRADPPPIFGIYRRPGKFFFFKYWIFRCLLFLRKVRRRHGGGLTTFTPVTPLEELDKPQPLSDSPKAFDAVFFMGASQDGYYIILGAERRKHNIVNGLFNVLVPGLGLLRSYKLPDTVLFDAEDNTFGAEGILIKPLEPMKKWKLSYTGQMWLQSNPSKQYTVMFNGVWTSDLPVFNLDGDMDPDAVATAMAREPWTLQYFKMMRKAHQTHYEQMGVVEATLAVDSQTYKLSNIASSRDHSLGSQRDWDLMHRYIIHMIFLEDGTKAMTCILCQPATCSVLHFGFVCLTSGEIHPVTWSDLQLYQHGEGGKPPADYAFTFRAGGRLYTVQVQVLDEDVHYKGWRWEARMMERFVAYTVDGVKGRGITEWHYHSSRGRPPTVAREDPAWFSDVVDQYFAKE